MSKGRAVFAALAALACLGANAEAAQCGSTAAGFEAWKGQFAAEARGQGISAATLAALMAANYATATIAADRGQRSFRLSLDEFLAKRGASAILARGRALKQSHAALFASIQQRYGVPPGPLLAIWGMETAFGSQRGNQHTLSAVATLAYDCRRSAFSTEQLYTALKLIDRGVLGDKIMRMTAQTAKIEAGHVFLPRAAHWLGEFQKEVMGFPRGHSDDQVDALSQGLAYVSDLRSRRVSFAVVPTGFY